VNQFFSTDNYVEQKAQFTIDVLNFGLQLKQSASAFGLTDITSPTNKPSHEVKSGGKIMKPPHYENYRDDVNDTPAFMRSLADTQEHELQKVCSFGPIGSNSQASVDQ